MKAVILAAISAAAIALPITSFAQQDPKPLTRAQVNSELAELERAGYNPRDWMHYPDNLQAAQRRVDAEHARTQQAPAK